MKFSASPEAAVHFTKMNVYLVSSWPLSNSVSRLSRIWFNIRWWTAFISILLLFLPLTNGIFVYQNDLLVMVKAVCLSSASAQALLKLLVCRFQSDRLQVKPQTILTDFLTNFNFFGLVSAPRDGNFYKKRQPTRKKCLQKYIEKSGFFHIFLSFGVWAVCMAYIVEPVYLSNPYPTDTAYPFLVKSEPLRIALYLQQIIALFFIGAAVTIDLQVATLLWFTCVKFEVLGHHFREVSSERQLIACIKKHQQVLWYAKEVKYAVQYITLATIATTTIGVICGCLALISLRVANIVANAGFELFIYAWPADNLIQVSQAISWNVYNSKWIKGSIDMIRTTTTVIRRSQLPTTISIRGVMPYLCLQYYTSFLSTTFSYFTTLRVVYATEDPEN